jgi:hypothetical protein
MSKNLDNGVSVARGIRRQLHCPPLKSRTLKRFKEGGGFPGRRPQRLRRKYYLKMQGEGRLIRREKGKVKRGKGRPLE